MAAATRQIIVVTGCQGKVGKHVVRELEARPDIHVVGLDLVRGVYDTWAPGSGWPETYLQADLQDAGAVYSCVARFKPASVIHVSVRLLFPSSTSYSLVLWYSSLLALHALTPLRPTSRMAQAGCSHPRPYA